MDGDELRRGGGGWGEGAHGDCARLTEKTEGDQRVGLSENYSYPQNDCVFCDNDTIDWYEKSELWEQGPRSH